MRTLILLLTTLLLASLCLAKPNWWSTDPYEALEPFTVEADLFYYSTSKPVQLGNGDYLLICLLGWTTDFTFNYLQRITPEGKKLWGEGIPVCTPVDSVQGLGRMVSDGAGGAILIWWDARGSGVEWELYGQRISADGEFLWDEAGVLLVTPNNDLAWLFYSMCEDGEGGAYITWNPKHIDTTYPDIYAQRIDGDGNLMWSDPTPVATISNVIQQNPKIALREGGGCFITWRDYRFYYLGSAAGQRLDPDGNTLWQTNGIDLDLSCLYEPTIMSDGCGGFLYRNWSQLARIDENGQRLWMQFIDGCGGEFFTTAVDFALSPSGKIYMVFGNDRDELGFTTNLYGQCFDLDGHFLWERGGIPLVQAPQDQGTVAYFTFTDNGFITAFIDKRDIYNTLSDVYFQIADSLGNILLEPRGRPLYINNFTEFPLSVVPDGQNGAIVLMQNSQRIIALANRILPDGTLGYWNYKPEQPQMTIDATIEVISGMISYVLTEPGEITISLYDILGRCVNVIEEGYRQAGSHVVTFDGSNLTSGLYLYRLQAGEFTATGKMMLVK